MGKSLSVANQDWGRGKEEGAWRERGEGAGEEKKEELEGEEEQREGEKTREGKES